MQQSLEIVMHFYDTNMKLGTIVLLDDTNIFRIYHNQCNQYHKEKEAHCCSVLAERGASGKLMSTWPHT